MANRNKGTAMFGTDLPLKEWFNTFPEEIKGPIDVRYFADIQNADTARRALAWISDQDIEMELAKRHTRGDIEFMWKAAFRGCLMHGVPIPNSLKGYARRLGVVLSE